MAALRAPFGGLTSPDHRGHPKGRARRIVPGRDADAMRQDDAQAERLRGFEEKLDRWRGLSRVCRGALTDLVLRESGAYAYAGGMPSAGRGRPTWTYCATTRNYEGLRAAR